MTNKDANKMESLLRKAQESIEKVGQMVCSNADPVAIQTYNSTLKISEDISKMFYPLYHLRP